MTVHILDLLRLRQLRPGAVLERNFTAHRRAWLLILSGFLEPLFYLLGLGVGVGTLVGQIPLGDGRNVDYAAFVAPAMLANAAMLAAITETTFNVFSKLKWQRLYDGILATPVRPLDIAIGEAAWALIRGAIYVIAFILVMVAMGLATSAWVIMALPAAMLIGAAFVGIGLSLSTVFRSWPDFDWVTSIVFILFLFSGTFAPVETYPTALQYLIYVSPLYHGIELVRGASFGILDWSMALHAGYLLLVAVVGIGVASKRMAKRLYK